MYKNPSFIMKNRSKVITRLIIINVIIFILANIFMSASIVGGGDGSSFLENIALSSDLKSSLVKPWTYITSMFTHLDFFHILFNMLYLWWFGKILQEGYGGQSVLASYVLGGLLGSLFYVILFSSLLTPEESRLAMGASAGVSAIMVAAGVTFPNRYINLFLIGPIKLKWIVLALFILTNLIALHVNIGGKIAHIGGALFGLIYAMQLKRGKNIGKGFDNLMSFFAQKLNIRTSTTLNKGGTSTFRGKMDRRPISIRKEIEKARMSKNSAKKEMEKMLDIVSKKGYENLSNPEKEKLKKLSEYF